MDPNALIQDYLDDELTHQQFAELSAWLSQDEANRETFIQAAFFDTQLHRELTQSDLNRFMEDIDLHAMQGSDKPADAEPALSFLDAPSFLQDEQQDDAITAGKLLSLAGYLAAEQLRANALRLGSIAALLVLGLVLYVVFSGPDDTPTDPAQLATNPATESTSESDVAGPTLIDFVATLTTTRNATWAPQPGDDDRPGALVQGTQLSAGQRLTLTQGVAEITTAQGAVAILQAPATFELINHNALRLHAGKLVGVCETDASKGFLVRTPHLDITDLGTRFGVDADSRETQVHVLEGEVQALRPDASADIEPTVLATGQSARTSVEVSTIATMDHDADRFAALMPEALRPDAAAGWQIVAINGQPLETPGAMKVAKRADSGAPWLTADQSYPQQANAETTFTVQTRFDLPDGVDADTATLTLQFDANDRVTQVHLNGRAFDPPANSNKDGHKGLYTMRIDGPLLQNGNTVQFDVVDVTRNKGTKWRLRAQWTIESTTLSQYEEEP